MAHYCIKATALDKIIKDRLATIEQKDDIQVAFWSGYQAALEWMLTTTQPLIEFHPSPKEEA